MTNRKQGTRTLASYIPVATAVVGATLVVASVVFFYAENDLRRLMSVTFGLGIVMIGVWFAANPFIRSTRHFISLRREVVGFINLVRVVNRQAQAAGAAEDIESTKAKMHETVERIVAKAGEKS